MVRWPATGAKSIPATAGRRSRSWTGCGFLSHGCRRGAGSRCRRRCRTGWGSRKSPRGDRAGATLPQYAFWCGRARRQDGERQREYEEDSAPPPGRLGEERGSLASAQKCVAATAPAHCRKPPAFAGLKKHHRDQQKRIKDQQREKQIKHDYNLQDRENGKQEDTVASASVKRR